MYVYTSTGVLGATAVEVFFDRPADNTPGIRRAATALRVENTGGADGEISLDTQATWLPLPAGTVVERVERLRSDRNSVFLRRAGGVDSAFRVTTSVE